MPSHKSVHSYLTIFNSTCSIIHSIFRDIHRCLNEERYQNLSFIVFVTTRKIKHWNTITLFSCRGILDSLFINVFATIQTSLDGSLYIKFPISDDCYSWNLFLLSVAGEIISVSRTRRPTFQAKAKLDQTLLLTGPNNQAKIHCVSKIII